MKWRILDVCIRKLNHAPFFCLVIRYVVKKWRQVDHGRSLIVNEAYHAAGWGDLGKGFVEVPDLLALELDEVFAHICDCAESDRGRRDGDEKTAHSGRHSKQRNAGDQGQDGK